MKSATTTQTRFKIGLSYIGIVLLCAACSGGGSSSGDSSSSSGGGTLSAVQSQATIQAGGSDTITPSGGTGPYTFTPLTTNAALGSLSATSGYSSVFQSNASGCTSSICTFEVKVTDNAGSSPAYVFIQIQGSSTSGSLTVSTGNSPSVSINNSISFSVTGGSGSYNFQLLTTVSGSSTPYGTLTVNGSTSATYTAPGTAGTAQVQVTDAQNSSLTTTINITVSSSGSGGSTFNCQGTYTMTLPDGMQANLALSENVSTGSLDGSYIYEAGYFFNLDNGYCFVVGSTQKITFTNRQTGSSYTGTVTSNGSGQNSMSGTFVYQGTSYDWSAVQSY